VSFATCSVSFASRSASALEKHDPCCATLPAVRLVADRHATLDHDRIRSSIPFVIRKQGA
jgi:hypothetical protein